MSMPEIVDVAPELMRPADRGPDEDRRATSAPMSPSFGKAGRRAGDRRARRDNATLLLAFALACVAIVALAAVAKNSRA